MSEPSSQTFKTFREAYCAYFDCPTDRFVESMFWHALYRRAVPMAWTIWWVNRDFFQVDFTFINAFGNAGTSQLVTQLAAEFGESNRRSGSILRRLLRVRVSGTRLTEIHDQLVSRMAPNVPEKESPPQPVTAFSSLRPATAGAVSRGNTAVGRADGLSLINRRCRSAHDAITHGKSLGKVLSVLGISEEQLLEHLKLISPSNPQYEWLHNYLKDERRLTELALNNEVLSRKVTSLTLEMDRLKAPPNRIP